MNSNFLLLNRIHKIQNTNRQPYFFNPKIIDDFTISSVDKESVYNKCKQEIPVSKNQLPIPTILR